MICVSLAETDPKRCVAALANLDFAEIRIDAMEAVIDDMKRVFSSSIPLIATFRPDGSGALAGKKFDNETRQRFLLAAIESGAAYVDIEAGSEPSYREPILNMALLTGCKAIISYHDYTRTPSRDRLVRIVKTCFSEGAHIAKIACMTNNRNDAARLLGLLDRDEYQDRLVVIGMGPLGRITRIAAPLLGSPFTFASPGKGKETAAGQIERGRLEEIMGLLSHG